VVVSVVGSENLNVVGRLYAVDSVGAVGYSPVVTIAQMQCFARDTAISVWAGGKVVQKPVQELTYDDDLACWDLVKGCLASAKPVWIMKMQALPVPVVFADADADASASADTHTHTVSALYEGIAYNLSTGAKLRTVGRHRVLDVTRESFEVDVPAGTQTAVLNVDKHTLEEATVTGRETIRVAAKDVYNVVSAVHMNVFADGVLTSCRLNNIAKISCGKFVSSEPASGPVLPQAFGEEVPLAMFHGLRLDQPRPNMSHTEIQEYVRHMMATMWKP
jgi:hypothetical protein